MTPNTAAGKEDREPSILSARSGEHVNELGQPARRRSLFERMTGVSRPRDPEGEPTATAPRGPVEPRLHNTAPQRAEPVTPRATAENPPARTQPDTAGKAAEPSPSPEEEVLEIPAFLRRQAN
jgi:cell division protein FtsZ